MNGGRCKRNVCTGSDTVRDSGARAFRMPLPIRLSDIKGEIKLHRCTDSVQTVRSIGGVEVWLYSFLITALEVVVGGFSVTPRPPFTPGKDSVPIVQEAWWAPGPVWTGAENLDPTGIRTPEGPVRSQSLYRLSNPGLRKK